MTTRRGFLISAVAASLLPRPVWADVGSPAYLSAALLPDGKHYLSGISARGEEVFRLPLPARGHAAAAHPVRPEAVAFARRPGTFAIVIDCRDGSQRAILYAPDGRHFYGHGVFSADGALLFTSENDFEAGQGRIGVWDVSSHYRRIAEFSSGGVGPHDLALLPESEILVVANGGIETHPDTGRSKLNLPLMRPNLSYVSFAGEILDQYEPEAAQHMNSIRHIALRADGLIGFAMQWQGDIAKGYPLLGLHKIGQKVRLLQADKDAHLAMQGYGASVAFSGNGKSIAISSPRGGVVQVFDTKSDAHLATHRLQDVSGVSSAVGGFVVTTGIGLVCEIVDKTTGWQHQFQRSWDNHLVRI